MKTYIALLRGINVSGQKMIKMADLIILFEELNFKNIQTYIQSGNIIFQSNETDKLKIEQLIFDKIYNKYKFEVPVLVLELDTLKNSIINNPFAENTLKDNSFFHITILKSIPNIENICKINFENYLPDECVLCENMVYLYCPNGYGKTKLNNTFFENKFKTIATTRNWKTMNTLLEMANKNI